MQCGGRIFYIFMEIAKRPTEFRSAALEAGRFQEQKIQLHYLPYREYASSNMGIVLLGKAGRAVPYGAVGEICVYGAGVGLKVKPSELLPKIKADIDAFVGDAPQFDDITMLCLEYKAKMEESK